MTLLVDNKKTNLCETDLCRHHMLGVLIGGGCDWRTTQLTWWLYFVHVPVVSHGGSNLFGRGIWVILLKWTSSLVTYIGKVIELQIIRYSWLQTLLLRLNGGLLQLFILFLFLMMFLVGLVLVLLIFIWIELLCTTF